MRKTVIHDFIALLGMVIVLGTAVVLDHWLAIWQVEAGKSFDFSVSMPAITWTRLIMAGLLLALAWHVLVRELSGLITAVLFTLVGLFTAFLPSFYFLTRWSWLPKLTGVVWPKGFGYLLLDTGAMIAIIGIVAIVRIGRNFWQRQAGSETAVT
ncbi:MAG: hypothetical protein H6669_09515 [Ardenticatenaceae bacterium]|nr:hypothetical protein [Ardenticatenaceae bacterium]